MATAFVESTLAQIFKKRDGDEYIGGMAFYGQKLIKNAIGVGIALSILYIIYAFYFGRTLSIVPYDITKNLEKYSSYLIDNKIGSTFFPSSYLRQYKNVSPYLINVSVGSEPCNGIYSNDFKIINVFISQKMSGLTENQYENEREIIRLRFNRYGAATHQ